VTTATTRQPISSQCSRPENSFRRSAWNGVQRVGVLITLGRCPRRTSRPIEERPSPPHEAPASPRPGLRLSAYKNAWSRSGATLVTFNRKSHGGKPP